MKDVKVLAHLLREKYGEHACICKYTMDESGNVYHHYECHHEGNDIPKSKVPYSKKLDN